MRGSCLCGEVSWESPGPLERASHCHCSRCRKAHGSAYATYAALPRARFRLAGGERVTRFASSPGFSRCSCGHCGSVVPGAPADDHVFVPLGGIDDTPPLRVEAHIFVASKAPWHEITDALPRFAAYPEGIEAPTLPDRLPRDPPGTVRGSCLCDGVGFVLEAPAQLARYCHCSRCRKARAAACAANLFLPDAGVRFTRGAELLVSCKLPGARFFTQCFCRRCGGKLPRIDPERKLAVVPMGALDDDPGIRPREHVFVGSKAAWDEISDALPRHPEAPP